MIKVFLIHDKDRTDRLKLYTKEVLDQDIEYEMIPAVKEYDNVKKNISEAHKNCIRRAQTDDLEQVIVLEDDVKFSAPGAFKRFLELSEQLPDNWDMLISGSYDYLGAGRGRYNDEPIQKLGRFSGLHCYIVHKRFYQRFINTRGVNNLDKNLRGNIYLTYPMVALQHDGWSDNTQRNTSYNITFRHKIKLWRPEELPKRDSGRSSESMDTQKDI